MPAEYAQPHLNRQARGMKLVVWGSCLFGLGQYQFGKEQRVVEPRTFEIKIGPAAEDIKLRGKFRVA
jgi:hypothetical protein